MQMRELSAAHEEHVLRGASGVNGPGVHLLVTSYDGTTGQAVRREISADPLLHAEHVPVGHPTLLRLYVLRLARQLLPIKRVSSAAF